MGVTLHTVLGSVLSAAVPAKWFSESANYMSLVDHGVALNLRYLCPVWKRRRTAHMINEGILEDLAAEREIQFAYPTTRFYAAAREDQPVRPGNQGGSGGGAQ